MSTASGVYVKLSDDQMTALDFADRWFRVYPKYEPVLLPFELIMTKEITSLKPQEYFADVFSDKYKNYVVEISSIGDNRSVDLFLRWLDDSYVEIATVDFVTQELGASDAAAFGQRYTKKQAKLGETSVDSGTASGLTAYIYDPFGTGSTAIRTTGIMGRDGARLLDYASTCGAGSYKSFAVTTTNASKFKGSISVYGVKS